VLTPEDAQHLLNVVRRTFDNGFRLPDPDAVHGGRDVITRLTREAEANKIRRLFFGG
jgi:hypothetical protein